MLDLEIYRGFTTNKIFSKSAYEQNKVVSPLAIYCAIFDRSKSEKHYLDLLNSNRRTQYLSPISKKLDQFKENLKLMVSTSQWLIMKRYLRRESKNISASITDLEFTPQTGYIQNDMENSNPSSVNFEEDGEFILVDELTRVLNQKQANLL